LEQRKLINSREERKTMNGKRFSALLLISAILLSAMFIQSHTAKQEGILKVSGKQVVTMEEMIDDLKEVSLVFVGEFHDRMRHHDAQLRIIRELESLDVSVAVGMEMFSANSQEDLDRWVAGEMDEEEFEAVFRKNWGSQWTLYKDIFLYARDEKIPLVGLNVPREIPQKVAKTGFASLSKEQLSQLPGVSCDVDAKYEKFIRRALDAHGSHGPSFTHFCEAQMVWDTTMAWRLLNYLENSPDSTVVVLAGSGHSWKRGIPEQVRRKSDVSFRVVLPEIPKRMDRDSVTFEDADYLWFNI
jgi:uncharacterized iron-regulated protein